MDVGVGFGLLLIKTKLGVGELGEAFIKFGNNTDRIERVAGNLVRRRLRNKVEGASTPGEILMAVVVAYGETVDPFGGELATVRFDEIDIMSDELGIGKFAAVDALDVGAGLLVGGEFFDK